MDDGDLSDFERTTFTAAGTTRDIFRSGSGPAVVVMAEIPGITPYVARFARRVVDAGFTAVMPQLFGVPGRATNLLRSPVVAAQACIRREFAAFAVGRTAPATVWLRALAADEHERCGGPGVGAVGMCFTGGFALGMAVDDRLLAPVLSQPSLPVGPTRAARRDLHLSPDDLARVKQRAADDDLCVLGLRFTGDRLVPAERFERLREELGDNFIGVELDSAPGNPHGHPRIAHSVLTEHLQDRPGTPTHDALQQVLDFLRHRLLTPAPS